MTETRPIADHLPVDPKHDRLPFSWWGMWLFIATEAMLFAALLSSYFYVRFGSAVWPLGGIAPPELVLPSIGTGLLLTSSATAHWAERGARRGETWRLRLGLALTVLAGLGFLGIQAREYAGASFSPSTNAYGSLFFGITGFHGLHVLVGLGMLLAVGTIAWRTDRFGPDRHLPVRLTVMYWHFVDVVWLFVFASLYLSVRY